MKRENWFYFLLGLIVSFLISIYWIGVYDNGYPGLKSLQVALWVSCIILLIVSLVVRFSVAKVESDAPVRKISKNSKKYIGSKDEKIYHRADCEFAKRILDKNKEFSSSTSNFRQKGYKPCDFCIEN